MEKVVPNSKFVGHSTEIIRQSKIKGPLMTPGDCQVLIKSSMFKHMLLFMKTSVKYCELLKYPSVLFLHLLQKTYDGSYVNSFDNEAMGKKGD